MSTDDHLEVRSQAELDRWLEAEGRRRTESIWLVSYKKHHPDYLSWGEIVETLLCHGWIDSTARKVDEDRSMLRISPRREGSIWSRVNKEMVARLASEGRITDAGWAVIDRAKADGTWTILDDVEALIVPDDLGAALDATPGARDHWESFPASARKNLLWWVKSAKRPETRALRVASVVSEAAEGRRANGT
ncbi:MAG: YdeI/OmpD-associated family protein [Acidimicrobiia bacterium]